MKGVDNGALLERLTRMTDEKGHEGLDLRRDIAQCSSPPPPPLIDLPWKLSKKASFKNFSWKISHSPTKKF